MASQEDEELRMPKSSATGTRTRVARVRAEYPNQLDYSGICIYNMSPLFLNDRRSWSNHKVTKKLPTDHLGFRLQGLGFRVWGLGFGV